MDANAASIILGAFTMITSLTQLVLAYKTHNRAKSIQRTTTATVNAVTRIATSDDEKKPLTSRDKDITI